MCIVAFAVQFVPSFLLDISYRLYKLIILVFFVVTSILFLQLILLFYDSYYTMFIMFMQDLLPGQDTKKLLEPAG